MRVYGTNSPALAAKPAAARRGANGGFTLSETNEARPQNATVSLRSVAGIDSLVALQTVDDPGERRRRAIKKGRGALDALDALKVGLLAGDLSPAALNRLRAVAAGLHESSGDVGLDAVLAEIELRVEVEIAKIAPR